MPKKASLSEFLLSSTLCPPLNKKITWHTKKQNKNKYKNKKQLEDRQIIVISQLDIDIIYM